MPESRRDISVATEETASDRPFGFVDGPNLYTYVRQNPWTAFDPEGLNEVVVSGGVNPDTKKDNSHDKYWGNFVQSAKTKITESQRDLKEGEKVEWMVQKSSLVDRAKNEGRKGDYYTGQVEQMAKDMGVDLRWFNNKKEFVQGMNTTTGGEKRAGSSLISNFTYYGHGSESALWLTYQPGREAGEALTSSDLPNAKNRSLYEKLNGQAISPSAFAPGATSTSWACNSAVGGSQSVTQSWANSTGVPMSGIIGRADYGPASPQYGTHFWNGPKPPQSPVPGNQDAGGKSYWQTSQP